MEVTGYRQEGCTTKDKEMLSASTMRDWLSGNHCSTENEKKTDERKKDEFRSKDAPILLNKFTLDVTHHVTDVVMCHVTFI